MRKLIFAAAGLIAAYSFVPSQAHAQAVVQPGPNVPPGVGAIHFWHTWVPWYAFGCPASIMLSAAVAGMKDNRELTYWEAYTCGLLYWFGKPPPKYVRSFKHK